MVSVRALSARQSVEIDPVASHPPADAPLTLHPLRDIPMVQAGDDLAALISAALTRQEIGLRAGDVLVVAQKVVSKAEGRLVRLADIAPSPAARNLAWEVEKDARLVELILRESTAVVRKKPGILIVRHRLGLVMANAGIDQSNVDHGEGECALLLPHDPDASARRLRNALGGHVGVVVSDSMNRPWRLGSVGQAIGSAGIEVLDDRCGQHDLYGRDLKVTLINRADAIAAAAVLMMGETAEGVPAALVRGLPVDHRAGSARDSVRPAADDLFL
ncbi:MAG: coenzyme F420-0:L-glutamate ligase [Pseudomonadota bacterium]